MNTLAKITKQLAFIFITLIVVSACKGIKVIDVNKDPTILRVKPYKVECNPKKPSEKLCFLINKKGSNTWDKEKIDSFSDYKWGYDYEIEVTPKTKDKPYKWEKTNLNTETPNRIFELTVTTATKTSIIKDTNKDNIYSIYGEIKIKCDPATECDTIETRIDYNQLIKFTMSYGSDNSLNIEKIAYLPVKPTLRINHYKVECDTPFTSKDTNGEEKARFLCLQIQVKNNQGKYGEWEKYAGDINGFTYKWGYNYEIEVTKLNTSSPIKYAFKRKISDRKAASDSLFRLTVSLKDKTADAIKHPSNDKTIYRIYDEIDFKCDPTENRGKSECDFIQSHIEQNDAFKFTMMHDKGALKTSGFPCASARSSFKTDCK